MSSDVGLAYSVGTVNYDYQCLMVQMLLYVHRNRRLIRDGCPGRQPPLSHTELLNSEDYNDEVMLNVLRCRGLTYLGQGVTNAEAWFNIALRPRKPEGSLGRTAQDGHLDSHTAPEL